MSEQNDEWRAVGWMLLEALGIGLVISLTVWRC